MDAPDPPTTPISRSASGRVVSNRASSGRPRRRIGPESEQGRTAATTRTAVDPCSLSGVLGDRIMPFYEVDKLKQIIQCYKTGGFPFPTWLATWKGTCPSCWLTFQKLATVTRHETVNGLVVHAACRDGPSTKLYHIWGGGIAGADLPQGAQRQRDPLLLVRV